MADIINRSQNTKPNAANVSGVSSSAISMGTTQIENIKRQIDQVKKLKNSIPKNLFSGTNKNAKKILLKVYKLLKKVVIEILKNLPICDLIGQIPLDEVKKVAKYAIKLRNETISLLVKILNTVTKVLGFNSILEVLLNVFNTIINLIPIITSAIPSAVAGVGIPVGVGVNFSSLLAKANKFLEDIQEILGLINDCIIWLASKLGELINLVTTITQDMFICLEKIAFMEAAEENPLVYSYVPGTNDEIQNLIQLKFNNLMGDVSPIPQIDLGIQEDTYKGFTFDIRVKRTVEGVPQNYEAALHWFVLSAEQGNAEAQAALGYLYNSGDGVLQDFVQAHMWLNIAAANGNEKAREAREEVAKQMTPEQIAEAQRMAKE